MSESESTDGTGLHPGEATTAEMTPSEWDVRRAVFGVFAAATIVGIVASLTVVENTVPVKIYVFGFLGASVYVFTSLAEKFDEEDRYALEIASKGMAAFPLSAGVYLLAFAFPGAESVGTERVASGLVFLAGAYVSLTLRALGGLARRMLGVERTESREASEGTDDRPTDSGNS